MIKTDVVVQGNSVAAMVTALELASKGIKTIILTKSDRWGGHFSGINFGSRIFDPGMLLYEFTSYKYDNEEDLTSFNSSSINDVGRFCKKIEKYISLYQKTEIIKTPSMLINGKIYDDFIISNKLSVLSKLPYKSKAEKELKNIKNKISLSSKYHPRNKNSSEIYSKKSYSFISKKIHGESIHENILEPLCKKAIGINSQSFFQVSQKAWLPFYYPETLSGLGKKIIFQLLFLS